MVNIKTKTTTTVELSREEVAEAIRLYIQAQRKQDLPKGTATLRATDLGLYDSLYILTIQHD